jgi:mono/diheme cytochrome c family protein
MLRSAAFVVTIAMAVSAGSTAAQNTESSPQPTAKSVWDGLYADPQAARGREAYRKACAPCHMEDLGGHEYAGALAGYPFQMKWEDASVAEVFGRIRTMPLGEAGSLTTQEYLDILAYLLQANGYPAGKDELTIAVAAQRWPRIRIERTK